MPKPPSPKVVPGGNVARLAAWKRRLRDELLRRKLAPTRVSADAGLSASALQSLLSTDRKAFVETIAAVCDAAGIDFYYVLTGRVALPVEGPEGAVLSITGARAIPAVSLLSAADWEVASQDPDSVLDFYVPPHRKWADAQCVVADDNSMMPLIGEGDIVYYAPSLAPRPGDTVVVAPQRSVAAMIRKWVPRHKKNGEVEMVDLQPLDASWPSLQSTKPIVFGTVVDIIRHLRRA